jgi:hypothetical protein
VAIVGAGPYGLSLAAQLRSRGVPFRIFGRAMQAWLDMSPGMYLKSFGYAVSIWAPQRKYGFVEWCRERGLHSGEPCEIAVFARYGLWAQRELVPDLEPVMVTGLGRRDGGFLVSLATGERVLARRVVVAVGLTHFERLPELLEALPAGLASHTSQHSDFSCFRGRTVAVLGAGQSALQAAALLHEHGAAVELFVRGDGAWFSSKLAGGRPLLDRIRYPNSIIGPGRFNWFLEHVPLGFHYLDEEFRISKVRSHLGPLGAWWLRDRVEGRVPIHVRHRLLEARPVQSGVHLRFDVGEGTPRDVAVDHVVAGTGFEIDVDRLPFFDPDLARQVTRIERAPRLSRHFETSVEGLHFIGPASAFSFGPLFRFVAGGRYAAPALARRLARTRRPVPYPRRVTGQAISVAGE